MEREYKQVCRNIGMTYLKKENAGWWFHFDIGLFMKSQKYVNNNFSPLSAFVKNAQSIEYYLHSLQTDFIFILKSGCGRRNSWNVLLKSYWNMRYYTILYTILYYMKIWHPSLYPSAGRAWSWCDHDKNSPPIMWAISVKIEQWTMITPVFIYQQQCGLLEPWNFIWQAGRTPEA